jgi:hypothetical protein
MLMVLALLTAAGCTAISVAPSCPGELAVGESGVVDANERNPGEIPTYSWSVFPFDAGTIEAPDEARTMFTAAKAGQAVLRITATDGIFMVQADCRTLVVAGTIVVSLDSQPAAPTEGDTITLTCSSDNAAVTEFAIVQTGGEAVELIDGDSGVVTFTPEDAGTFTFECSGETAGGAGGTASVSVTVESSGRGGRGPRG